ncbi:hypothetical protein FNV43_RR10817 [Rhamnella rubrinervis]|uniref:Uncharacterized protein n=1 Tax=Rhamnella rubrinervis TaxID=2594499 RepID=A0A8K0MH23_9ROSA|nr:hypothetical protein FNV43_RR10817 [Rhamnella rubrinervis]
MKSVLFLFQSNADSFVCFWGTAFSVTERDCFDLRGLLPPNVMSSEQQIELFRTAGLAIAEILGAVRAQERPMIDFPKQNIVVAGAGRSYGFSLLFYQLTVYSIIIHALQLITSCKLYQTVEASEA